MGIPTERDVIAHTHWEGRFLSLRNDRHLQRDRVRRQGSGIIAIDLRESGSDIHPTEQGADDSAFAGPIRTGKGSNLTARTREAHSIDSVRARAGIRNNEILDCDHDALRSWTRKNGTPRRAVIAPSGNSIGEASVRAARSAATTSVPPINPAARISGRCARRPIARAMCGTTSPTNPTRPAAATVAAARIAARMNARRPARSASTPSETAVSSPSASTSISRAQYTTAPPTNSTLAASQATRDHVASVADPIIHQRAPRIRFGSALASATMITALANAPTITPAISSVRKSPRVARPPVRPTASVTKTAATLPPNAARVIAASPVAPRANATTAPTAAPPETPSKYGSASGLRRVPCNIAPLAPRPAPTSAPRMTRGSLRSRTMAIAVGSPCPRRASNTEKTGTDTGPFAIAIIATASRTIVSKSQYDGRNTLTSSHPDG